MKHFSLLIITLALSLFIVNKNSAQYTEIGIGLGISSYWGDLNTPSFSTNLTSHSGATLQLSARKIFKKYYGIRGSFSVGSVKGNDAKSSTDWQQLRNLSFKSSITELAVLGEFYVFGFDTDPGSTIFLPYVTAGLSGFRFDPKTVYQGNEIRLQPLGTEGQGMPGRGDKYSLYSAAMLAGAGAKIIINENLNISMDVILRRTFTDYLDDVSTTYVNYDDLNAANGTLAANLGNRMNQFLGQEAPVQLATGSIRGGANVKDYYFMSVVSLNMMLSNGRRSRYGRGNKVICPKF